MVGDRQAFDGCAAVFDRSILGQEQAGTPSQNSTPGTTASWAVSGERECVGGCNMLRSRGHDSTKVLPSVLEVSSESPPWVVSPITTPTSLALPITLKVCAGCEISPRKLQQRSSSVTPDQFQLGFAIICNVEIDVPPSGVIIVNAAHCTLFVVTRREMGNKAVAARAIVIVTQKSNSCLHQ